MSPLISSLAPTIIVIHLGPRTWHLNSTKSISDYWTMWNPFDPCLSELWAFVFSSQVIRYRLHDYTYWKREACLLIPGVWDSECYPRVSCCARCWLSSSTISYSTSAFRSKRFLHITFFWCVITSPIPHSFSFAWYPHTCTYIPFIHSILAIFFFLVSSLYLLFQGSYPTLLVLVWMGFASGFLSRSPYSLFLAQSVLGFSRFLSSTRLFLRSTGPRFCEAPCFGLTKTTRISYLSDTVIVSRYSTLDSRYQVSLQIRVPFQHHLGGGRRHVWSLEITPVLIIFISHYSILLRGRSIRWSETRSSKSLDLFG